MTNGCTLKSWFVRHAIVPQKEGEQQTTKPVAAKPRVRQSIIPSHGMATSLEASRTSNVSTGKSQSSRSNHIHPRPIGQHANPVQRNINPVARNPTMPTQNRFNHSKPPVSIQYEADHEPMSQLSFSQDFQCDRPHGQYSLSDSKSSSSRGIYPFNMNQSTTISSASSSVPRMNSYQTTASSANGIPFNMKRLPTQTSAMSLTKNESSGLFLEKHPMKYHEGTGIIGSARVSFNYDKPSYESHSSYRSSSITRPDGKSFSSNSPQEIHPRYFQSASSTSSSQFPGVTIPDGSTFHELIDHRIKVILEENFGTKMKEFDDRQLSLYRRIAEAQDQQSDYIKEVGLKRKECMNQIQVLAKRSNELNERASDLESKACHMEKLHLKVVGMLKSVESSALKLKDLAKTSIEAIFQAKDTMIQSSLPFLEQKIVGMATTAFNELGSSFKSMTSNSSAVVPSDVTEELDQRIVKSSKENNPLVGERSGLKNSLKNSREAHKTTHRVVQPSQALSPIVPIEVRAPVTRVPKSSKSPTFTTHSCVTPCAKATPDFGTPLKKRTISSKNVRAKRQRSRYGHIRTLHFDGEEEYAFLSN